MQGTCSINGQKFDWSLISGTSEFPALSSAPALPSSIDVLRITGDDPGFDIAIRIDHGTYAGGQALRWLGPFLVLGNTFPNREKSVAPGTMLRLRPRLAKLPESALDNAVIERVIQWCTSENFRAVRVNAVGGIWQNYGEQQHA